MKRLIYALMALLGFGMAGCDGIDRAAPEYGCPHVNFNLKARVVDEAGEPIPGIEVRLNNDWGKLAESDNLGEIDALGSTFPGNQYEVVFKDVDGEENGGDFESVTITPQDMEPEYRHKDVNPKYRENNIEYKAEVKLKKK